MIKASGESLYLKKIGKQDITEDVMNWFSDKDLMKYYSNSQKKITEEILIDAIESGAKKGDNYTYGIFVKDKNLLIGTVKIGPINFVHRTSDLVTLIGNRDYLGKGLSVEAIKLGNELAFNEYDLRKLYGGMYISNISSIKAYCRAGWIIEGRLKGFYIVNGKNEDRLLVACFNPKYFSNVEIEELIENEKRYFKLIR